METSSWSQAETEFESADSVMTKGTSFTSDYQSLRTDESGDKLAVELRIDHMRCAI